MFDRKTVVVATSSFIVGAIIVSTFFYFYPFNLRTVDNSLKIDTSTKTEITANASALRVTPTSTDQRMLTYQNRQFGFQIKYPENFFAEDRGEVKLGSSILSLVDISRRDDDGYTHERIDFSVIKKEKAADLYKRLIDEDTTAQTKREEKCKLFDTTDFDQCAYYGGGWNYSLVTFAGVDAVSSKFAGEGSREVSIYLPPKGIQISYSGDFGDHASILDSLTFFDEKRAVRDPKTNIEFICPAFWTCDYFGPGYHSYADQDLQEYLLYGPTSSAELLLGVTTTIRTTEMMKKQEAHFAERKKERDDFLSDCLTKSNEQNCQSIMEGTYWPKAQYTLKKGVNSVYVFEETAGRYGNDFWMFIPQQGIIASISGRGTSFDLKFLEELLGIQ